jgi:hypothetical protein
MKMEEEINSSIYVRWELDNSDRIKRAISSFMKILTIDEKGNWQTTEGLKLEIMIRVLIGCLIIPDLQIQDWDIKHGLIYKSLFRLKNKDKQNIFEFQAILANEVKEYLSRPVSKFSIIFPLHVTENSLISFHGFEILDTRLEVRSWDSLDKELDLDTFYEKSKIYLDKENISLKTDFTPIFVSSEGSNGDSAFNKIESNFELLRTILNLLLGQNRFIHRWGGYPKPLATILPSPVYGIFKIGGEWENVYYSLVKYSNYGQNEIKNEYFEATNKLTEILRKPENSDDTMYYLVQALGRYGQALDTPDTRLAFVYFWQILELLTLKTKSVTEKVVINRVTKLLKLDQMNEDYLSTMYQSRNSLIHENIFPDDIRFAVNEVGLLKSITDIFLSKMFNKVVEYPTTTKLTEYFQLITKSQSKKSKLVNS